ncbi:GR25 family glycosyltransferase involved in LPS biosynthesis [Albidovulum inexpectatum]|uniref:GR25 family glycosyltransferase involved in LPS biosynthesis n=1 Tax=Albidovulum inexpectatum TaxID=196587 RepID=A0A2S5JK78_9RHOB|nr:glycosyltransferase family 25 protein [Albidovulum inexpectatum]PPB81801.1 GR25 family glycosyltransferase involved in LPS biosynthesis [Albidovulum inexpectatum]
MRLYVINLGRRSDRWAFMSAQLAELGLEARRIEAVDASREGEVLRSRFDAGALARDFPATLGDVACTLTHQSIWLRIADEGAPAIILEDDARLSPAFAEIVRLDLGRMMREHDMGAIKLEYWPGPQNSRRFVAGRVMADLPWGMRLYRLRSTFLGTAAYAISPQGAALMCQRFPRLAVPVDHALFGREANLGFRLLRPGFINPAPVLHDIAGFSSDIVPQRRAERLAEMPRPWTRRLRDWVVRSRLAREIARGECARIEMRFADQPD